MHALPGHVLTLILTVPRTAVFLIRDVVVRQADVVWSSAEGGSTLALVECVRRALRVAMSDSDPVVQLHAQTAVLCLEESFQQRLVPVHTRRISPRL